MIDLVVVGGSGAGRRVADIAQDCIDERPSYKLLGVLDDQLSPLNQDRLVAMGVEYLGGVTDWLRDAAPSHFLIGIGASEARVRLDALFVGHGYRPARLIHPRAHVSKNSVLAEGCVISPNVEISTNARIGRHVHVMANAAVSHDCVVGDFVNINPGAVIAGNVTVGPHSTVGAGAVVLQGLTIGARVTVGAASCVTRPVPDGAVVKGVPGRW